MFYDLIYLAKGFRMRPKVRSALNLLWPVSYQHAGVFVICVTSVRNEPHRDKTNKMACAPSEDSDQPGHPPSLIRVFAVRMKKAWVLSYPISAQRRLWSDWADAQADLSLSWAHSHIVGFVTRRLKMYFFRPSIYDLIRIFVSRL